jgi:multidrug efflux pump subunit AcrA (membrane-fusion protein)
MSEMNHMMKSRKVRIAIAVAAVAALAGLWHYRRADAREATTYRYATITRGDIQSSVSATGTIAVGVSIPLWDRGSADLATQRAQIEEDNARLAMDT